MSTHLSTIIDGTQTYIGGAPRSAGGGQVILFKNYNPVGNMGGDLTEKFKLTGEKFASGFGYSITTLDLNGDR